MPKLVDLTKKPYNLSKEDINWVEQTIAKMTIKEKIGQLFFNLFMDLSDQAVKKALKEIPFGGARYATKPGNDIQRLVNTLNKNSKIPLFVACNCDSGGDGAASDGTYIASAASCEASCDTKVSYNTGYVSGKEAVAIGCNWNFDPCSDILFNWRNTIVNTRAYGCDPDTVIKHVRSYIKGLKQSNILSCVKHFPGDGSEERDQHLVLGVNELTTDEWDKSYGKVYQTVIDDGLDTMMVGHIAQPAYSQKLNPKLGYNDIMPATLSPELVTNLLKEKLGFNGLVVTDASHMLGITGAMRRCDYVPRAIASGCDMFLFVNNAKEDFNYMLKGYENGVITKERLTDALRRILGMKAKLGLHNKKALKQVFPEASNLKVLGCKEHLEMAKEAADKSITLIKNTLKQLPITPKTHPRIKLYVYTNNELTVYGEKQDKIATKIKKHLVNAGFKVFLNKRGEREKGSIEKYRKSYDAAIVFSDIKGYAAENNYRIRWSCAMSNEIPWFVWEVPTVFVSLSYTTHLIDVPMVKAFINAYHDGDETIKQTINKIMGKSNFKGKPNKNVWCGGLWEAKR